MGPYRTAALIPSEDALTLREGKDDDSVFAPVVTRSDSREMFGARDWDERDLVTALVVMIVSVVAFTSIWIGSSVWQ